MIKKLSEKIVDKLMSLTGTSSQREVYVYGLECFLNEVLNIDFQYKVCYN